MQIAQIQLRIHYCTPCSDAISGPKNRVCEIKSGHDFCRYRNSIQVIYFQINGGSIEFYYIWREHANLSSVKQLKQKTWRISDESHAINLGPRVFSDKAADEDPGKIHFIFPKFWGKKRMRSEAQRMLLIKNNAGAYYF